jgi:hypothetical protein
LICSDKQLHINAIFLLSIALRLAALRDPGIPIGQSLFSARLGLRDHEPFALFDGSLSFNNSTGATYPHDLDSGPIDHKAPKKLSIVHELVLRISCE